MTLRTEQIVIQNAVEMPDRLLPFFEEYRDYLLTHAPELEPFLMMQSFDDETEHLHEKYGAPGGGIYIVSVDGEDAGCIAFRRLDDETCELKRVFLRDRYRGLGLGRKMMERVLTDSRAAGYKVMLLDTLPVLSDALGMYDKLGFERTEKYNDNPLGHAIYLKLNL